MAQHNKNEYCSTQIIKHKNFLWFTVQTHKNDWNLIENHFFNNKNGGGVKLIYLKMMFWVILWFITADNFIMLNFFSVEINITLYFIDIWKLMVDFMDGFYWDKVEAKEYRIFVFLAGWNSQLNLLQNSGNRSEFSKFSREMRKTSAKIFGRPLSSRANFTLPFLCRFGE